MKLHLSQLTGTLLTFDRSVKEVPGVVSFRFKPQRFARWEAGQYYVYLMPGDIADTRFGLRPFTVSSAPQEGFLQISTRISEPSSRFKRRLLELKPGAKVIAAGPYGFFTLSQPLGGYVFIAGGIGITPFRSILLDLAQRGPLPDITLLYSNRDDNVLFRAELDGLVRSHSQLKVHYIKHPGQVDASAVRKWVADPALVTYYVSGPPPMVKAVGQMLVTELNVLPAQVKYDVLKGYPWPLV